MPAILTAEFSHIDIAPYRDTSVNPSLGELRRFANATFSGTVIEVGDIDGTLVLELADLGRVQLRSRPTGFWSPDELAQAAAQVRLLMQWCADPTGPLPEGWTRDVLSWAP